MEDTGIYARALGEIATPDAMEALLARYRNPPENREEFGQAFNALVRMGWLNEAGEETLTGTRPFDPSPYDDQVTGETREETRAETSDSAPETKS